MQHDDGLTNTGYEDTLFSAKTRAAVESRCFAKKVNGKDTWYCTCLIRNKEIRLTPEERIRQMFLYTLIHEYGYEPGRFEIGAEVQMGSSGKRADVVVFEKERPTQPYIIVELKRPDNPTAKEGKKQLESYCKFSGASIGVWTDGRTAEYFYREEDKAAKTTFLNKLTRLPNAGETLSDVLNARYTMKQLYQRDELRQKQLSDIIQMFEDHVMANSGEDSFDEIFKVLFTKLYDEYMSMDNADEIAVLLRNGATLDAIDDHRFRALQFRDVKNEDSRKADAETAKQINALFDEGRRQWKGVFDDSVKIKLKPSHLRTCVSFLQDIKLFNSNLDVVDDAFEYLSVKAAKGEKGQYFTPRYVIDMCVKMLNPKENETMIDTAAGSSGFPMHTVLYVWGNINPDKVNLFTNSSRSKRETNYVRDRVFAIEFDPRSVRVSRMLNIIAGDGHTNVIKLNTLDYTSWDEELGLEDWNNEYYEGFARLEKLRARADSNKEFTFDILMANPPFAGDITEERIISTFELSKNAAGKRASKIGRDILFIERNIDFLKPGGRMAIVLPQGRFNNSSDKYIREFIAERCRILAVVGLHGNVFKPHTGTKTSVLFAQKWNDDPKAGPLCPRKGDYNIFFATMREPSKDSSGEKILLLQKDMPKKKTFRVSGEKEALMAASSEPEYSTEPLDGNTRIQDIHRHWIVKHDLFSQPITGTESTPPGIAEAFIEFAKKEKLSFF